MNDCSYVKMNIFSVGLRIDCYFNRDLPVVYRSSVNVYIGVFKILESFCREILYGISIGDRCCLSDGNGIFERTWILAGIC
jgi:hypothetical protein